MKKFIFFFLFSFEMTFQLYAVDYYWVGGSGNYSDVTHWATASGAAVFHSVAPTDTDDVYFDVNSFFTSGDTVWFDIDYNTAHDFIVNGVSNNPTFVSGPLALELRVTGDFQLEPGINWQPVCDLGLMCQDPSASIQTANLFLTNSVAYFSGIAAYTLLDDFNCSRFIFEGGSLLTLNHAINCSLQLNIESVEPLYLGTSIITSDVMDFFIFGGVIDPPMFCDSAIFVCNVSFNIGDQTDSAIHFGTVTGTGSLTTSNCFYKTIICPGPNLMGIYGHGNHIDKIIGDAYIGENQLGQPANVIGTVMATRVFIADGRTYVDTVDFQDPGAELAFYDTLTINGDLRMTNSPSVRGIIGATMDSAYLFKANGIVCFDFADLSYVHAIGGAQYFAGSNSIDIGGTTSGFQYTGCVTAGGAWPGDANYDLVVNNLDILALGVANGETGPIRSGASFSWVEQPVTDWTNTFLSGVNMKHADCDGNGTVETADTAALSLNYGYTHPASRVIGPPVTTSIYFLTLDVSPDSVGPSSQVHVNVDLNIDSIYGIAFSVSYDPALIDPSSLLANFGGSWLGTPGVNMIGFAKIVPAEGRIDFALTRTDHTDAVAGAGHLLSFDIVTASTIPAATSLNLLAENVSGSYLSGAWEPITGVGDSAFVDSTVSVFSSEEIAPYFITQFNGQSIIISYFSSKKSEMKLTLTDMTGRAVLSESLSFSRGMNAFNIETGNIAGGMYLVVLSDGKSMQCSRAMKVQ